MNEPFIDTILWYPKMFYHAGFSQLVNIANRSFTSEQPHLVKEVFGIIRHNNGLVLRLDKALM